MEVIRIIVILALLFFSGCKEEKITYAETYIEDNYNALYFQEQADMCDEIPDSMFCSNLPTIGDIKPTEAYVKSIVRVLSMNTKYEASKDWHYTETVHEYQVRDCEDEAMTMIHHMVDDGIDKKYLSLAYILMPNNTAHLFVGVDTIDKGMLHMDLSVVQPIESQINWHMRMDDAGVYTWIKGNIK